MSRISYKTFADFKNLTKFYKNKKTFNTNFLNFDHSKPFPGVTRDPTKNVGPSGSAVLAFIGYKQTNRHPDKPNLFIDISLLFLYLGVKSKLEELRGHTIVLLIWHTRVLFLIITLDRPGKISVHFNIKAVLLAMYLYKKTSGL